MRFSGPSGCPRGHGTRGVEHSARVLGRRRTLGSWSYDPGATRPSPFEPGFLATLLVAGLLGPVAPLRRLTHIGAWIIAAVFLLRGVGDFRLTACSELLETCDSLVGSPALYTSGLGGGDLYGHHGGEHPLTSACSRQALPGETPMEAGARWRHSQIANGGTLVDRHSYCRHATFALRSVGSDLTGLGKPLGLTPSKGIR